MNPADFTALMLRLGYTLHSNGTTWVSWNTSRP